MGMVNREKREVARRLLDEFLKREITGEELADSYPRDKADAAIGAIYERVWGYWDDGDTGRRVPQGQQQGEARAVFERCMAFLDSNLEYEWPPVRWFKVSMALLRACGFRSMAERKARESLNQIRSHGNLEVWPFIRKEDYERFSSRPR